MSIWHSLGPTPGVHGEFALDDVPDRDGWNEAEPDDARDGHVDVAIAYEWIRLTVQSPARSGSGEVVISAHEARQLVAVLQRAITEAEQPR